MGMVIKELLASETIQTLLSNHDPALIRQDRVVQAAREFLKAIRSLELYPNEQLLIDRFEALRKNYPSIYAHRPFYIWQLGQAFWQLVSLNLSDTDFLQSSSLKFRIGVATILLDDICDMGRDKAVFDKCLLALEGQIDNDNWTELYQLLRDIWAVIQNTIKQAPNYTLLKPTWEEAYQKWIDSFEYSLSIYEESSDFGEAWERDLEIIAHSTSFYLNGLIDLLFVPNLSTQQVSSATEVFLRTQKMVQLADWAATWERELPQRDFTSGVFTMALQNGWITSDDLMANDSLEKVRQQIRNSPVEGLLWKEWERLRIESHQIAKENQLPGLDGYIDSFSVIMFIFIVSTGLI
jgi:hypothetical protein